MENIEILIKKMEEMFKDIADPDVFPQTFAYQVKLARYELFLENLPKTE